MKNIFTLIVALVCTGLAASAQLGEQTTFLGWNF